MQIKNLSTGEIQEWSIDAMLDEINRDRSGGWTNYDKDDYLDGWDEWVEGQFLTRHI